MIDDHSAQPQQLQRLPAFDGHVRPPLKDALKQPIERLNGFRAQFMEHFTSLQHRHRGGDTARVAWRPTPNPAEGTPDAASLYLRGVNGRVTEILQGQPC